MIKKRQSILLDLDTIVDSCLGCAIQHFPDKFPKDDAEHAAFIKKLSSRPVQSPASILGVEEEQWQKAWSERNVTTLLLSPATKLAFNLTEILDPAIVNSVMSPIHEPVKLTINFGHYSLTDDERQQYIDSLKEFLPKWIAVGGISRPLEKLTIAYIKETFDVVFIRDFVPWLALHNKEFEETKMPTVVVHYPALLHEYNQEVLEMAERKELDPFKHTQFMLAEAMTAIALDLALFSVPG